MQQRIVEFSSGGTRTGVMDLRSRPAGGKNDVAKPASGAESLLHPRYCVPSSMRIRPEDVGPVPAGVESLADLAGEWVVAQVRTNYERSVAAMLASAGVGYYLPVEYVYKRNGGGNRTLVQRILFRGYVFACCRHCDDRYELVAREHVARLIDVVNQRQLVRELSAVELAAREGMLRDPNPELQPGRRCVIVRGGLKGYEGWIDERDGKGNVVLKVTILGASRPTTIPIEDVEPI